MNGRPLAILALAGFLFGSTARSAQLHGIVKKGEESIRTLDLDAPCTFEKEYAKGKADKTDPRVAFIETFPQLHPEENILGRGKGATAFQTACFVVSDQTTNTDSFYDPAHRFFQAYVPKDTHIYNESLTYFAGGPGHEGVLLSFIDEMEQFKITALAYRNNQWIDATEEYLGQFKLSAKDFLILPQYGRAIRVLQHDPDAEYMRLKHRGWLMWNGKRFEFSTAKTLAGWRCPDHEPHVLAGFFSTDAPKDRLPDFCRTGGESEPVTKR